MSRKRFPTPALFDLSKMQLIAGIFIFLAYSVTLYSLLYLMREAFRVSTHILTEYNWILTDKETSFYNVIYAFVAVIISMNLCFTYWFDKPRKIFSKNSFIYKRIVHDQRTLSWYFLSWFSKLAVVFAIIFGLTFYGGFYTFSFYPDYNYVFILIIIVLFLQSFITIRTKFRKKGLTVLLISGIIVSSISFGLSRINLINYQKINGIMLNKDIHHKFNLDYPESSLHIKIDLHKKSSLTTIHLVKDRRNPTQTSSLLINNKTIEHSKVDEEIAITYLNIDWFDKENSKYLLRIDKEILMKDVNPILKSLANFDINRVYYAVKPLNLEYNTNYYRNLFVQTQNPYANLDSQHFIAFQKVFQEEISPETILKVETHNNSISVNDISCDYYQIQNKIEETIHRNKECNIILYYNNKTNLQTYIDVISTIQGLKQILLDQKAMLLYSKSFIQLDYDEKQRLIRMNPIFLYQIPEEF